MRPPKWLRPTSTLDGDERLNQQLALRVIQIILAFMIIVIAAWGAIVAITGSGLFLPRNAEGVLKSTETPQHYAWTSESIRQVRFPGRPVEEQSALRSAVVNLRTNQFQTVSAGVLADRTILSSDGRYTVRVGSGSQNWELATDVCNRKPTVPASAVAYPAADEIARMSPRLLSDKATIFNQRAWLIEFTPTPEFIGRIMWLPFFDAALPSSERRWVLSAEERQALADGKFKVEYAHLWVNRDKPRHALQYDIKFRFTNQGGSAWRFLLKLTPQSEALNLDFGEPDCRATSAAGQ